MLLISLINFIFENQTLLYCMYYKSCLFFVLIIIFGCSVHKEKSSETSTDLVIDNNWFVAGPTLENEKKLNDYRLKNGVISVTATKNPVGEIELNVPIIPSLSNDGKPIDLSEKSTYVEVTYKSSQEIKLQAREGNTEGTGCIHGGSHPRVSLPSSPNSFSTIKIYWNDFKQDELADGKKLNIHNLCKFNFVNYHPIGQSKLQIKSVRIQNLN